MIANATTGTNTIEAKTNNIGTATVASINTMGNAGTSRNTMTGAINTITGTTSSAMSGANASVNLAGNSARMAVNTDNGGSFSATATSATMRAGGNKPLATNGTTGITSAIGAGAVTSYNEVQTVATDKTIGNLLVGKQYQNVVNGNLFVDGNVYINGTLDYVSSNSASTTVIGVDEGTSIFADASQGTLGGTNIIMKGTDGAEESVASLTLTNGYGNTHGVEVYENRTVVSGGAHSTTMTLDDDGATFANVETGGPTTVTGVADGRTDYDAVNYRQLKSLEGEMSGGIAMASAFSSIPQVDLDKKYMLGAGVGHFNSETALAVGGSVRLSKNCALRTGVALSDNKAAIQAGIGFSW